jgi:hypothetical protein
MALRLVFAWIGLNIGALLLLATVDFLKTASKRLLRALSKPQRLLAKPQSAEPQH